MLGLGREGSGGDRVTDVIGIEKCDQNIDVEQRAHSIRILFAQPIDLFVRH